MKACAATVLVSMEYELPESPAVSYAGVQPYVGCNHIVCRDCGAVVKHLDHHAVTSTAPDHATMAQIYDSAAPEEASVFDARALHANSRAYYCRCNLYGVELSGARLAGLVDLPWKCAGHPDGSTRVVAESARDVRVADAERKTAALVDEQGLPPDLVIHIRYGVGVNPDFSTPSQLRAALLASFRDAEFFGGKPLVGMGRDDDAPAWGWVAELVKMRSDWWEATGIALQHATQDGGDIARLALVALLASYRETVVLLPWTRPLAQEWPDVRTEVSATGWGAPEYTLASVIRDQVKYVAEVGRPTRAYLMGYGEDGKAVKGPFTNERDLQALLDDTAKLGQFPRGENGPWSWLGDMLLVGYEWLPAALQRVAANIDRAPEANRLALLDFLSEERDLWRFVPVLEQWQKQHPAWWSASANSKPSGWRYDARSAHWPNIETQGDIVKETLRRARNQVASPSRPALPLLYGTVA